MTNPILRTGTGWWPIIPRLIAGGVLTLFGAMKLVSPDLQQNVGAMLEQASIPGGASMLWVVAAGEILAGVLLLSGALARVGAALAVVQMLGALYVHFTIDVNATDPPIELPPHFFPVVILLAALVVLVTGSGRLGVDACIAGGGSSVSGSDPAGA